MAPEDLPDGVSLDYRIVGGCNDNAVQFFWQDADQENGWNGFICAPLPGAVSNICRRRSGHPSFFLWRTRTLTPTATNRPAWSASSAKSEASSCLRTCPARGAAVQDGDEYIINANKRFITTGQYAEIYAVMAFTDKSKDSRGISAFVVEKDRPGITMGKHENKLGLRLSNTCNMSFDDVRVPASHRIGAEGEGLKSALGAPNISRAFVGALRWASGPVLHAAHRQRHGRGQGRGHRQGAVSRKLRQCFEPENAGKKLFLPTSSRLKQFTIDGCKAR